jgi:hypothetical protein
MLSGSTAQFACCGLQCPTLEQTFQARKPPQRRVADEACRQSQPRRDEQLQDYGQRAECQADMKQPQHGHVGPVDPERGVPEISQHSRQFAHLQAQAQKSPNREPRQNRARLKCNEACRESRHASWLLLTEGIYTSSRIGSASIRYCGRPVGSVMVVVRVLMPRL